MTDETDVKCDQISGANYRDPSTASAGGRQGYGDGAWGLLMLLLTLFLAARTGYAADAAILSSSTGTAVAVIVTVTGNRTVVHVAVIGLVTSASSIPVITIPAAGSLQIATAATAVTPATGAGDSAATGTIQTAANLITTGVSGAITAASALIGLFARKAD